MLSIPLNQLESTLIQHRSTTLRSLGATIDGTYIRSSLEKGRAMEL